jgi:hypothetical protein
LNAALGNQSVVELEEFIMATRTVPNAFFGWTWSAVLAGVLLRWLSKSC